MIADTWVQTNTFDDLFGVQSQAFRVAVQLIEKGDTHRQIGIGEELDCLSFSRIGEQHIDIFLDRPLLQQRRKALRTFGTLTNNNTRRMKVVVKRLTFAQEFWGEDHVINTQFLFNGLGKPNRDG
ncbi:hypothetical protein D3C86_1732070 [compost metagenome]